MPSEVQTANKKHHNKSTNDLRKSPSPVVLSHQNPPTYFRLVLVVNGVWSVYISLLIQRWESRIEDLCFSWKHELDQCELWCFFNSNSDGTHSLQKIHLSASDVRLNFSHSVLMKKQTLLCLGWPKCKFQHIFMFRWIVPLTKIKKKWALQIYRNCNCFAGNFGDRYFGTDAPSDCYESDEGMDYWISSRPVCERLYLHTLEKETFKHLISYDCGPIALTYISINLCHLLLSILAILCATNEPVLNKGQSINRPPNMGDYCSLAFLEMSSWHHNLKMFH